MYPKKIQKNNLKIKKSLSTNKTLSQKNDHDIKRDAHIYKKINC